MAALRASKRGSLGGLRNSSASLKGQCSLCEDRPVLAREVETLKRPAPGELRAWSGREDLRERVLWTCHNSQR